MSHLVVDASVVVAMLKGESGSLEVQATVASADRLLMPASSVVEAGMAARRVFGDSGYSLVRDYIADLAVEVVPFTQEHAWAALDAWAEYGKTSGHPAKLNFGDCCTYATAKIANAEIAYVGEDFAKVPSPRHSDPVVDLTWSQADIAVTGSTHDLAPDVS